jgi:hypothetical protein
MALCFVVSAVHAQTTGDYRSVNSGPWSTVANWQRYDGANWVAAPSAPTDADGVITIRSPHTINTSAAVSANQIVIDAGGNLVVNATLTLVDVAGDEITVNGTLSQGGQITGGTACTVNCNNTWNWTSSTFAVAGTVNLGATLNILTGAKTLNGSITNNGTCNWSASDVTCTNSTFVNNSNFNITGNNFWSLPTGTNSFVNNVGATVTKSIGTGVTNFGVPITNSGTLNLQSGTFRFGSGVAATFTNTGNLNFATGAIFETTINVNTTFFNAGTTFTGTSTIENRNGATTQINVPLSVTNAVFTSGFVSGSGNLSISGSWNWQGTTISIPIVLASTCTALLNGSAKTLTGGVTLTNNGTLNWGDGGSGGSGSITLNNASVINASTGIINEQFTNNRGLLNVATGNSFTNNGTINKTTTFQMDIQVPFVNGSTGILKGIGTYNATSPSITNDGIIAPGNSAGTLTINPALVVGKNATLEIEIINASGEGVGNDLLILSNATALTTVDIDVIASPSAPIGFYTIMRTSAGLFSSYFATVDRPSNFTDPVVQVPASSITIHRHSLLPVVWGAVNAKIAPGGVLVSWETLSETNTSHFEIEHSLDGAVFETVGRRAAAGNSSNVTKYEFLHIPAGAHTVHHFRIKQVDKDGKAAYSIVVTVKTDGDARMRSFTIINPVHHALNIKVQANTGTILVSNSAGQLMLQRKTMQGNHSFDVSNWPSGVYYVQFRDESGSLKSEKFIKN